MGCRDAACADVHRCVRCALPLSATEHEVSGRCRLCEDLPPLFDHALAALDYTEPWGGLVSALKFQQDTALADGLAGLLAHSVRKRWLEGADSGQHSGGLSNGLSARHAGRHQAAPRWRQGAPSVLVPVPLSSPRWRERGYNQSALLARHLGVRLALQVCPDALVRTQHTERLMRLDADARAAAIRKAFAVPAGMARQVRGRHVALVDDVLTTGATANAAARALWEAGAREVSVWAVARTPAPSREPITSIIDKSAMKT
jgi:ComF family protein